MDFLYWFSGGDEQYHTLYHCMRGDIVWIVITIVLDILVASGYIIIAHHWNVNEKLLDKNSRARHALSHLKNIFIFCGICGYIFIPIKMFWPAWRLYDFFLVILVFFTWKYA